MNEVWKFIDQEEFYLRIVPFSQAEFGFSFPKANLDHNSNVSWMEAVWIWFLKVEQRFVPNVAHIHVWKQNTDDTFFCCSSWDETPDSLDYH